MLDQTANLNSYLGVSTDGVIVIGGNDVIVAWNDRAEQIFGWPAADVIGQPLSETIVPAEHRERHLAGMQRYLATGERHNLGKRVELKALHRSGREIAVRIGLMTIELSDGEHFFGFVHDLTAEEETRSKIASLQMDLDHLTRVNAMGTIASMIAHELNQPLTAAANYLSVTEKLLLRVDAPEEVLSAIAESRDAIFHAGDTIKSVRALVSRNQPITAPCALRALIDQAVRHTITLEGCAVVVDVAPAADHVLVNKVQIEQVLHNLMTNALHAMQGQADCRLTVGATVRDPKTVEVRVTDSGSGMSDGIFAGLFSTLGVTTKVEGLGIGLSICRTIIEQHHGRIWAERGKDTTTFCFTLPKA